MKPSSARASWISRGRDLSSREQMLPVTIGPVQRTTETEATVRDVLESRPTDLPRKATLKKAVDAIRSKEKTRKLVELCGQVTKTIQKSNAWFAKYEKFFRSPVWKLVSDEALRKAHFKCEYWRCMNRATHVHLLELPEEHLEPGFDWMNRGNILMALCAHHHQVIHGFVMKRVIPSHRLGDSTVKSPAANVLVSTISPQLARPNGAPVR